MLLNTGQKRCSQKMVVDDPRLQIGKEPAVYAREGSIAITERWFNGARQLGLIEKSSDVEALAATVEQRRHLLCPGVFRASLLYWLERCARAIVGMTRYVNKGHISRLRWNYRFPDP